MHVHARCVEYLRLRHMVTFFVFCLCCVTGSHSSTVSVDQSRDKDWAYGVHLRSIEYWGAGGWEGGYLLSNSVFVCIYYRD